MPQPIDIFARGLSSEVQSWIHNAGATEITKRKNILWDDYKDPDVLRSLAARIKQHTLDHLFTYLEEAEARLLCNGVTSHFAATPAAACAKILDILRKRNARRVVKSKSMATEEIHLNAFLEKEGIECVETDLGEFIIQIDNDRPSHIVKPIIHKNRSEVARSFERHGLGAYNDEPEIITRRARQFLRGKYLAADAAITGANFVIAESGRLVLVTNEGNSRFSLAPVKTHIALVGIEKILPKDRDLSIFLNLLARSATGQHLTVYTEFISGPRARSQPEGPEEMHVVFMDNGRSGVLASPCRAILRCIRCGACLNVCPVYRQASGHAYRAVYPGPVGAVLSPLLAGEKFASLADLPKASSLCGACNEVCPVDIPIPELLLRLRDQAHHEGVPSPGTPPMVGFALLASMPLVWRSVLFFGRIMNFLPIDRLERLPIPYVGAWLKTRTLPQWRGGSFRKWMKKRQSNGRKRP